MIRKRFSGRVMIAMRIFQSGFDVTFLIKVCLKIFRQSLAAKR